MPLIVRREQEDDLVALIDRMELSTEPRPVPAVPPALLGRDLLLYDGVCRFCNRITRLAACHDPGDRWRFVALQSDLAAAVLAPHGIDPALLDEIHVIAACGTARQRALSGADAGIYLYSTLSGWPRLAGRLLQLLPLGLRRRLYSYVAARRYRWFGRHTECILPTPAQARRYVL